MNFKTLNFVMLSIFMSLLISCDNNKQASQEANKINTPSSSNPKIVYVNIDTLLTKYNLYIDKKSELEAESKVAEKSLAGKLEAFRRRAGQFQQEIAEIQQKANTIAPVELKKMEERYARQQQDLMREEESLLKQRDNAAIDLDKKLQETQKDLQSKIDDFLAKVADEKGYDLVLMKGSSGSVMYGRNTLDITDDTVKRLNEEYTSNKTKQEKK
ncbi:MAG: OmpH family outer membrane protein [Saprospiraceae bacterium]|jgi:outer membrane protein|nr:OmpH family outer membrane protein [Saprospiraceae bacterium]MBK9567040.1 OmpH family outer membrane protein [Saprospiraceae bacterium]